MLFRRDFNLNVQNNNIGFANRYTVHLAFPFNSGPGTILDKTHWDCGPGTFFLPAEMRWESDVSKFLIFHFFVRVQAFISGGQVFRRFGQVWETTSGLILEWRLSPDFWPNPNFVQSAFSVITFFNPAYFDHQPQPQPLTIDPKVWADGPPH